MTKTDILKFFLFFIGMCCISVFMQSKGLIAEFMIIFYIVFIGFYVYKKQWQQMYSFFVNMLLISFLKYVVNVTGTNMLILILVFPLLKQFKVSKLNEYFNKAKSFFKWYWSIIDKVADHIVYTYIKKK